MPGGGGIPDWKDRAAYAPLLNAERSAFAWEWLRRSDGYRAAAAFEAGGRSSADRARHTDALSWGLHGFEDPALATPDSRPVWTAARCAHVLRARAQAVSADEDSFDVAAFGALATVVAGGTVDRLLLSDGFRSLRIDTAGASLLGGPVLLRYDVHGLTSAERPLLVLRQFIALVRRRAFTRALHPPLQRAAREVLLLRAWDAVRAGAPQREIAAVLLSARASGDRWRVEASSLRSQAQRLVRQAGLLAAGGFWSLLQ